MTATVDTNRMAHAVLMTSEQLGIPLANLEVGTDYTTAHIAHCHDLRSWAEIMPARVHVAKGGILQARRGWLTLQHEHSSVCGLQRRRRAAA